MPELDVSISVKGVSSGVVSAIDEVFRKLDYRVGVQTIIEDIRNLARGEVMGLQLDEYQAKKLAALIRSAPGKFQTISAPFVAAAWLNSIVPDNSTPPQKPPNP